MSGLVKTFVHPDLSNPRPLYSHITTVQIGARLVYTAGLVGTDAQGVADGYEAQVRQAYSNLGKCLNAVGAGPKDIVKLKYFIVNYDPNNRPHTKVMLEFLQGHSPSTTLVPVPCLARPDLLFEVEAVAAVKDPIPDHVKPEIQRSDVIIVGAGLSGLQAARDIDKVGLSYKVLEARDRVGGKVWTAQVGKGIIELGATWTNNTNQPRVWRLGKELGLEFVEQNISGDVLLQSANKEILRFPYGGTPKFTASEQENLEKVRDFINALSHEANLSKRSEYDQISVEDFARNLQATDATVRTVTLWTRAMLGVEPSELSALFFLEYCRSGGGLLQMRSDGEGGGQHLRCTTGMTSLATGLASKLKPGSIVLNSAVVSIDQSRTGDVLVTVRGGQQYRARKVILSVPTPLLQDITFSPPLPEKARQLSQSTSLGTYSKAILRYSEPWWTRSALCGLTQSFVGPVSSTRDTSNASVGHYSLTCFIVGEPARTWGELPSQERRQQVLDQLADIFGPKHATEARNPVEYFEQEWSKEEFSKGAPCPVTAPGILSGLGSVLGSTFQDIHFVGTETGRSWKGYMEGALESGERGAGEILDALGVKAKPPQAKL